MTRQQKEQKINSDFESFKKQYPSLTSGDWQTFILGWNAGFEAVDQPQDTTLEEDGELDVTPGKWYVGMHSTVRSNIEGDEAWKDSVVCVYSGGNEDNAYLIAQAKNMYAMLKKLIADHDETSTSYLSEKRKNIELAKQLLNNCKPKP